MKKFIDVSLDIYKTICSYWVLVKKCWMHAHGSSARGLYSLPLMHFLAITHILVILVETIISKRSIGQWPKIDRPWPISAKIPVVCLSIVGERLLLFITYMFYNKLQSQSFGGEHFFLKNP